MSIFFLANALWWGYRAGATIARGYLDWEAARNNTTLDVAFANYRRRGGEGVLQDRLIDFVQFNNQFAWTDPQQFAIDSAAVATAGLGLAAKIGLGKRIAAVMGVKNAVGLGTLIDGVIDFTGALFAGGLDPSDQVTAFLRLISTTKKGINPVLDSVINVVRASTGLTAIVAPILQRGIPTTPAGFARVIVKAPAILAGITNLFGALVGFWAVAEPLIPDLSRRPDILLDPQFRDAALRQVLPLDPGLRRGLEEDTIGPEPDPFQEKRDATRRVLEDLVKKRKLPTIHDPPTDPGDPPPVPGVFDPILIPGGGVKIVLRPPVGEVTKRSPGDKGPARVVFTRHFLNRNATDLRAIIEELKKG